MANGDHAGGFRVRRGLRVNLLPSESVNAVRAARPAPTSRSTG
jgi:hypothetical protein